MKDVDDALQTDPDWPMTETLQLYDAAETFAAAIEIVRCSSPSEDKVAQRRDLADAARALRHAAHRYHTRARRTVD